MEWEGHPEVVEMIQLQKVGMRGRAEERSSDLGPLSPSPEEEGEGEAGEAGRQSSSEEQEVHTEDQNKFAALVHMHN